MATNLPLFVQRKLNKGKPGLKVYWYKPDPPHELNFGDNITGDIIERLWGLECEWADVQDCELIGAGSIVGMVVRRNPEHHKIKVWGSGLMFADKLWGGGQVGEELNSEDLDIYAVRGPLTGGRVATSRELVFGDPGLLANLVYSRAPKVTHKIGVVAHFIDADNPMLDAAQKNNACKLISPLQSPEKVARDITSCQLILSSSLHGLIFADSFGVPNFWAPMSDRVAGGDYKFKDYYMSTGRELAEVDFAKFVAGDVDTGGLITSYKPVNNLRKMQRKLIASFPYQIEFTKEAVVKFATSPSYWKS